MDVLLRDILEGIGKLRALQGIFLLPCVCVRTQLLYYYLFFPPTDGNAFISLPPTPSTAPIPTSIAHMFVDLIFSDGLGISLASDVSPTTSLCHGGSGYVHALGVLWVVLNEPSLE